jgi:site-specific DNA recombinase
MQAKRGADVVSTSRAWTNSARRMAMTLLMAITVLVMPDEADAGQWSYGKRQWVKVPGTNRRLPRKRDDKDVIRKEYPERRILDAGVWDTVQARLATVRAHYVHPKRKDAKGSSCSGHRATHPLSGILKCGVCGAPIVITAGTSARYYVCSDAKKRGTCPNRMSPREDVARTNILRGIRDHFCRPEAIKYLRARIAEMLGGMNKELNDALDERRGRLERTHARIAGLIEFIARGDHSGTVRTTLFDLEAQAKAEREALAKIERQAAQPIPLPSPDELVAHALDLENILKNDPAAGREALRRLFDQGRLMLHPQEDGYYVAKSRIFPLMALTKGQNDNAPSGVDRAWYGCGCAGRI